MRDLQARPNLEKIGLAVRVDQELHGADAREFTGLDADGRPQFSAREIDARPLDLDATVPGEQPEEVRDGVYRIKDLVEKPPRHLAPSNKIVSGRYILQPEVMRTLKLPIGEPTKYLPRIETDRHALAVLGRRTLSWCWQEHAAA